ncbi:hypothetical protein [Massilia timonae]|uniref:hypothetical protein n=1 Tax=Massilia timonae TaxID=47229 RepID=UPI00289D88DF|nr:hypothetical protein [Massilia timonae]
MAEFDTARIADLAQKITGHEAICGGFEFRILCVAESATLALKYFIRGFIQLIGAQCILL